MMIDDQTLTAEFFQWVDENQDQIEVPIMMESIQNGVVSFLIDNNPIKLDIGLYQVATRSSSSVIQNTCQSVNLYLSSNPGLDLGSILGLTVKKYEDLKDFQDQDWDSEIDDYTNQIMMAEHADKMDQARKTGIPVDHFSQIGDLASNHFVFREATAAIELLDQTLSRNPDLLYSLSIKCNPMICNIRLEIDLSFLDISDSSMVMLGLSYDYPLVISLSLNENTILQTSEAVSWTPALLGALQLQILQGGMIESYGCKEYVLGRVNKYKEDVYNLLKKTQDMPSLLTLSRETSVDGTGEEVSPQALQVLLNMGFSRTVAIQTLRECGNSVQIAVQTLSGDPGNNQRGQSQAIVCNNFFYNLLFYVRDRMQNCTNYCFICYKKHLSASIRLRACNKEICEFRFEEISGISVFAQLKSNSGLIMLDLSFASEALFSNRGSQVFEPFPSFMLKDQQMRGKSGFLQKKGKRKYDTQMDQNKDMQLLRDVYQQLPNPMNLKNAATDEASLREIITRMCGNFSDLSYKLLKYVIATNRLALVKLDGPAKIPKIDPNIQQYIVTNHPPETIRKFNHLKRGHGSIFAFHGSSIQNWYSILRNGLRVLSNTHMMTAGAASGAGVYTAENSNTSVGYCRVQNSTNNGWPYSILNSCGCIAIV